MLTAQTNPAMRVRQQPSTDCLIPAAWELVGVAALLPFYTFFDDALGDDAFEIVNAVGPFWLAIVLIAGAVRMVNIDRVAMWCGLFWFRVATAVYFGFGSIVHNFFNTYTLSQVTQFFYAEDEHKAKFNLITALSVLCVLGAATAIGWLFPRRQIAVVEERDGSFLLAVALVFLLAGYPAKYLVVFPHSMGAFGDVVLPGSLTFLVWLTPTGLYLLTDWCLRFSPRWLAVPVALLVLDLVSGFLLFSKSELLLPLLMFILAVLNYKVSFTRLLIAAAAVVSVFLFIEPTAGFGRQELSVRYGAIRTSSFSERFEIISRYFNDGWNEGSADGYQGALVRIAYVHSAAPAIALYDRGEAGNSLENILAVFIPRALWPEKPVFDMGAEYTRLINGSVTSSTWMGYFVEAYWNFGWFGIPLLMIPLGAIYVAIGRYTLALFAAGRWLHFPAAFLGMWMGIRVDGVIVTDIVASVVVLLVFHVAANVGTVVLRWIVLKTPSANEVAAPPQMVRRPRGTGGS